jgi:hypothetical protein
VLHNLFIYKKTQIIATVLANWFFITEICKRFNKKYFKQYFFFVFLQENKLLFFLARITGFFCFFKFFFNCFCKITIKILIRVPLSRFFFLQIKINKKKWIDHEWKNYYNQLSKLKPNKDCWLN